MSGGDAETTVKTIRDELKTVKSRATDSGVNAQSGIKLKPPTLAVSCNTGMHTRNKLNITLSLFGYYWILSILFCKCVHHVADAREWLVAEENTYSSV